MSEVYITDISQIKPIKIASIPATINTYSYITGTLSAGEQEWVIWTSTPSLPQTSLWNVAVTVRFGTDSANYEYPAGSSLTTNQKLVQLSMFRNALQPDEKINQVSHSILMRNNSVDSFSYYMYYKVWTFATSIGTSA